MKTKVTLVVASVLLAVVMSATAQPGPATAPAGGVTEAIRSIQSATQPQQAIDAYGRGAVIDRSNPALNEAYMRKMLQFGQARVAAFPARVLVSQQDNNGLALGVLAYNNAVAGDYSAALNGIVCAAGNSRDNPGILRDAGMLVSWYDNAPSVGKVPYAGRCLLREIRRTLEHHPEYMDAYNRVKDAIATYRQQSEDIARKIEDAQSKLAELRSTAADLDIQLRQTAADVAYRQSVVNQLANQRNSGLWTPFGGANNGWQAPYYAYGYRYPYPYLYQYDSNSLGQYQQDLNRQIVDQQGQMQKDVDRQQSLAARAKELDGELRAQQAELSGLRDERKLAQERLDNAYIWDPPAVDGVITPPAPPLPTPRAASGPAMNPETAAQYRIELARMLMANGRNDLAAESLRDVIANFPQTSAATQAQQMLETMP